MKLQRLFLLACLFCGVASAQQANPCGPGQNCKALSYTSTKGTGAAFQASGDAGVRFGDGTLQNTAATAFSGSATSYTATAAADAMAFKANRGAQWCLSSDCTSWWQSDGGVPGVSQTFGIIGRTTVADTSGNSAFVLNGYNQAGSTITAADLFQVRNNGSAKFTVSESGAVSMSQVTSSGGFFFGSRVQPAGTATLTLQGTQNDGATAVGVGIGNSTTFANAAAKIFRVCNGDVGACASELLTVTTAGISVVGGTGTVSGNATGLTANTATVGYIAHTAQTINNTTWTTINFDQSSWDPASLVTNPTTDWTFTAPATGYYMVTFSWSTNNGVTAIQDLILTVKVNGTRRQFQRMGYRIGAVNANTGVSYSSIVSLTSGDTLSPQVYQDSGGGRAWSDLDLFGIQIIRIR